MRSARNLAGPVVSSWRQRIERDDIYDRPSSRLLRERGSLTVRVLTSTWVISSLGATGLVSMVVAGTGPRSAQHDLLQMSAGAAAAPCVPAPKPTPADAPIPSGAAPASTSAATVGAEVYTSTHAPQAVATPVPQRTSVPRAAPAVARTAAIGRATPPCHGD